MECSVSQSRLEQLAYRMLGSVADAEDVVQEARVRLLKQDLPPENEDAWLFRVVTNLSLDKLRAAKRQREAYPGPWLPEPLPTNEPESMAELAESLSLGLVLMLERLSPAERAVFVLREGFDLAFSDIAELLDTPAASCRQRFRRAKAHLAGEGRINAPEAPVVEQKAMLERLMLAVAKQDLDGLVQLFTEDCVAYTDGGGIVSAAIRPVTEPARIAQVTLHLAARLEESGGIDYQWLSLNGGIGLLIVQNGKVHSTLQLDLEDGLIKRIYIVRNPVKLAHLAADLK
jgi:RNA polymerase sigma factor (sigma-70 family)